MIDRLTKRRKHLLYALLIIIIFLIPTLLWIDSTSTRRASTVVDKLPSLPKHVNFGSFQQIIRDAINYTLYGSEQLREVAREQFGSWTSNVEKRIDNFNFLTHVYPAGITLVQGPNTSGYSRGVWSSGSSFTLTLGQTPTNGNALILGYYNDDGPNDTIRSISQTGVTWSGSGNGKQLAFQDNIDYADLEIWIGTASSGAGKTITITLSSTPGVYAMAEADACEWSGLASSSSVLDKTATYSGAGEESLSSATGTTATTTQATELWIGITSALCMYASTQSSPTYGFTLLDGTPLPNFAGTYYSLSYLYNVVSATGAASSGTTIRYSGNVDGVIATFKASTTTTVALPIDCTLGCRAYFHFSLIAVTSGLRPLDKFLRVLAYPLQIPLEKRRVCLESV